HAIAAVDDVRGVVPDDDLGRRRTRPPRAWAATSPQQNESRSGGLALGFIWLRECGHQGRSARQKRTSAADWHVSSRSGILPTLIVMNVGGAGDAHCTTMRRMSMGPRKRQQQPTMWVTTRLTEPLMRP